MDSPDAYGDSWFSAILGVLLMGGILESMRLAGLWLVSTLMPLNDVLFGSPATALKAPGPIPPLFRRNAKQPPDI